MQEFDGGFQGENVNDDESRKLHLEFIRSLLYDARNQVLRVSPDDSEIFPTLASGLLTEVVRYATKSIILAPPHLLVLCNTICHALGYLVSFTFLHPRSKKLATEAYFKLRQCLDAALRIMDIKEN